MNRMMLTAALTALIAGSAFAQGTSVKADRSADRPEQLTERMTKRLNLTEEQAPKVLEINQEFAKEMAALRKERKAAKEEGEQPVKGAHMEKAKELNQSKNEKLKEVLTPEQMAGWDKMQEEIHQHMKERRQEKLQRVDEGK